MFLFADWNPLIWSYYDFLNEVRYGLDNHCDLWNKQKKAEYILEE